jgi:hypothetical protein
MGVLFEDDFLDDFGTSTSIGSQPEPSAFKAWSGRHRAVARLASPTELDRQLGFVSGHPAPGRHGP